MSVSKEEFDRVKNSRRMLEEVIQRETRDYLLDGGVVTRLEKGGEYTYLASEDGINLYKVVPEKSSG